MAVYFNQGADAGTLGCSRIYRRSTPVTGAPVTIATWVAPNLLGHVTIPDTPWGGAASKIVSLIHTGGGQADNFNISMQTSGNTYYIYAQIGDFVLTENSNSHSVQMDEWHHAAAVFGGSGSVVTSLLAYMDGIPATINTNPSGLRPSGQNTICVGSISPDINDNRCYRVGCLADVALWDIELTEAEVGQLASGARPDEVQPAYLVVWLKLTDSSSMTTDELGAVFTSEVAPHGGSLSTCVDAPPYPTPPDTGPLNITFSLYKDTGFKDWDTADATGDGADFDSYLYTYFHMVDDNILWMQSPYVYTYLQNTARNNSDPSLFLQPVWEWSDSTVSSKFSRMMQIYDYKQDQTVSNTKNRVRGTGRALQLRFTSDSGKDFNILGWGVWFDKNAKY